MCTVAMSGGLLGVDIGMALFDVLNQFRDGCGGGSRTVWPIHAPMLLLCDRGRSLHHEISRSGACA